MTDATMETVKASRRKQTKPNRNPFGMDPQSGSFNPAAVPASRPLPVSDSEESPQHDRGFDREQEMSRESEFEGETSHDSRHFERELPGDNGGLEGDRGEFRDRGDFGGERETPVSKAAAEEEGGEREIRREPRSLEGQRSVEDGDAPLDMSIVSCRMCPETFATSTDLHHHVDMVHGPAPKRSRMDFDFPTAYHRLGSELLQENLPTSEEPQQQQQHHQHQEEALSLTMPKPQSQPRDAEPAGDQFGEGRSVKVNGGRIFHMDAYCELCDREFCNKYFLKTHKAIRHGIAEDSSPSTPSAPETSQKLSPGGSFHPLPPKVELSPSPWRQQQELKKDYKTESRQESPSSRKSEADLAAEEKVSSVISAVKNSLQNSQSESKSSSGSGSGSSTKDPSMEDYCEFCQKHFCNKYYLKKHKQDVHGIIPETGPTTTKRSRASSSLLDLPMPSTSMGSHMLLPQPMPSLGGMHSLPPGMMMLNPFMPQMTLLSAGNMPPPLLHAPHLHPPPHSPALSQSLPLPGAVPGLSPTTPTSQVSEFSPNPDTFCNLCSKEFSTVYFLRIHKANKHGIPSEELPPDAKMLGEMVESNGVFHPRPPSSMDGKYEGSIKSSPPPLTSINQMVTCRLCDKDFPNAQAYKIHQVNEHGKNLEPALPDSYESSLPKSEHLRSSPFRRMSGELPPAHGGVPGGPGGTMFGNMMAARMADRVTCDICQKDLCNKYFLRVHKLKTHGIDMDKEEGHDFGRERMSMSYDRYSPGDSASKAQPLNMTMSPKHGPPALVMPKAEVRDLSNGSKDFKMEKPGGFKSFTDVPTFLSETINNEYLRRSTPQPPFKGFDYGMPGFPPSSSGSINPDQLLGEGIDPEAYCDICKKEFCSKYFLRTHKENIHGIKTEVTMPSRSRAKPGPKPSAPKLGSMISSSGGSSCSSSLLAGLPIPSMPFPFPPGMMMRGANGGGGGGIGSFGRSRDSFEKHHFRWKDPPTTNATARVTCDICHKELCNKYFLRTHKLKKHGIAPTDSTQSPMSDSPAPSENDAGSNQSNQPDNFLVDRGTVMGQRSEGSSVPQSIPLPPSERSSKPAEPSRNSSRSEEDKPSSYPSNHIISSSNNNNNNNNIDTVTCHLCDRKFRNMQWLSAHIMKDHAEAYSPELMDLRMLPPPLGPAPPHFGGELEPKVCQVCRILLPNEISLKLHLLQEHNAQIKLQMDERPADHGQQQQYLSPSFFSRLGRRESVRSWRSKARKHAERKTKMFVCAFGDYRTHWLYKLQLHEKKAHGIAASGKSKSGENNNGESKYDDGKQFKCGLCTSRFRSHTYCQMHLREAHIHMLKDFVSQKRCRNAFSKLSCRYCSFTTSFPFRLHSHTSRYHHRPAPPPDSQEEKTFPDLTPVACSETPPESLHSSPDHSTLEEAGFDRSTSGAQDLRKRPFGMDPGEEGGAPGSLADTFLPGSPVDSRVHQSLSASYRMSEFTP